MEAHERTACSTRRIACRHSAPARDCDIPPPQVVQCAMSKVAFLEWVRCRLAPRLRHGRHRAVQQSPGPQGARGPLLDRGPGGTVKRLPPYSHEVNPIEAVWGGQRRS